MSDGRRTLLTASAAALLAVLVAASPARAGGQQTDSNRLSGFADIFFHSLRVIGLTADGRLVHFRAGFPRTTRNIGFVSGLVAPDTSLVGIDFRVQDGFLYGVGNRGGIYTIDTTNAKATLVSSLSVALSGTFFGVDFNPAADRLRIISDKGQNLRHNLNDNTTLMDDPLDYPPAAPPDAAGVTGAAYTNNDNEPAANATTNTTLFDIDAMMDQVVIQSPPNNGSLVATGKLGVDADPAAVGFDIYSLLDKSSVTVQNHAFASLLVDGKYGFYRIGLKTGKATFLGNLGDTVVDIAIPLKQ